MSSNSSSAHRWAQWDAQNKGLPARNFDTHPINKVPNRHNTTGDCFVSSDCMAWLTSLRPVAPRNARVKFYDIDPCEKKYEKKLQRQNKSRIALAKLGLCEGDEPTALEVTPVIEAVPVSVVITDKPKRSPKRANAHAVQRAPKSTPKVTPDAVAKPPAPERPRTPQNATAPKGYGNAVRRAFRDWTNGRAQLNRKGSYYMVKNARTGKRTRAPWDGIVRARFTTVDNFNHSAREWRQAYDAKR